jgi:hypothetical protein
LYRTREHAQSAPAGFPRHHAASDNRNFNDFSRFFSENRGATSQQSEFTQLPAAAFNFQTSPVRKTHVAVCCRHPNAFYNSGSSETAESAAVPVLGQLGGFVKLLPIKLTPDGLSAKGA